MLEHCSPRVANWPPKFGGILLSHNVQHFTSNLGQIEASTPHVKPLELISTFAPIGMLDLG
jgi:hypothetical protein